MAVNCRFSVGSVEALGFGQRARVSHALREAKLMLRRESISLLFSICILAFTLHAQTTTLTVEASKEIRVAEDKQEIKMTQSPKNGTALVNAPSAPDQTFRLIYRASDATEKTSDELGYQI